MFEQKAQFSVLCKCPVKLDIDKTLKIILGLWESQLFPAQEAVKYSLIMQKTLLLSYPNQIHQTNAEQYVHCFLVFVSQSVIYTVQTILFLYFLSKGTKLKITEAFRILKNHMGKKTLFNVSTLMFVLLSECCSHIYLMLNMHPS